MIIKTHYACDCGDYCEWCSEIMDDRGDSTEQAINILAGACDLADTDSAMDTLLNAICYLRSGHYPFTRKSTIA